MNIIYRYLNCFKNGQEYTNAGFLKLLEKGSMVHINIQISPNILKADEPKAFFGCFMDRREPLVLQRAEGGVLTAEPVRVDEFQKYQKLLIQLENGGELVADVSGCFPCQVNVIEVTEEINQVNAAEGKSIDGPEDLLEVTEEINQANAAEEKSVDMPEDSEESQVVLPALKKWQWLIRQYPHIIPFGDQREFLSIRPEDFIILCEKSYEQANNSFCMHQYMFYHHLILGKLQLHGAQEYCLGVPGHFSAEEKKAAQLYGYHMFLGETSPARENAFGYFVMRVEL